MSTTAMQPSSQSKVDDLTDTLGEAIVRQMDRLRGTGRLQGFRGRGQVRGGHAGPAMQRRKREGGAGGGKVLPPLGMCLVTPTSSQ